MISSETSSRYTSPQHQRYQRVATQRKPLLPPSRIRFQTDDVGMMMKAAFNAPLKRHRTTNVIFDPLSTIQQQNVGWIHVGYHNVI
jgi:hypothetical protein